MYEHRITPFFVAILVELGAMLHRNISKDLRDISYFVHCIHIHFFTGYDDVGYACFCPFIYCYRYSLWIIHMYKNVGHERKVREESLVCEISQNGYANKGRTTTFFAFFLCELLDTQKVYTYLNDIMWNDIVRDSGI